MKDKVMIFMCSLVLTLALVHTESALATESATELVLAANGPVFPNSEECERDECSVDPGDNKRKCPAKNKGTCEGAGGDWDKKTGFCTIKKMEKTKNCGGGFRKVTTKHVVFSYNKRTGKCKKIQSRTTECQQKQKGGWIKCKDKFCEPCKI